MKVSKVGHVKAAVSKKQNDIEGILYQYPPKKEKENINVENRVNRLNITAKNLYKIFNPVIKPYNIDKSETERYDQYKGIVNLLNEALNECIKRNLFDGSQLYSVLKHSDQLKDILIPGNEEIISEILTLFLRKGLKKEEKEIKKTGEITIKSSEEGIKNLFAALCKGTKFNKNDENFQFFLSVFYENYYKKTFAKHIERAIKNQNMPVQPIRSESGKEILNLAENKEKGDAKDKNKSARKQNEKKGLSTFLSLYANLDEKVRMDYLRKLRRLVTLYFHAPRTANTSEASKTIENAKIPEIVTNRNPQFNVWEIHEMGKEDKELFAEVQEIRGEDSKSKAEKRRELKEQKRVIRERNMECYRYSIYVVSKETRKEDTEKLFFEDDNINKFWIHHIESAVERILLKNGIDERYKNEVGYLQEKVWKDILNYMSIKYIAIGKAVFNFAMEDLLVEDRDIHMGKISKQAINGLTSFDYEQIKAKETLQREIAVPVMFAANNLARAAINVPDKVKGKEDLLTWGLDDIKEYQKGKTEGQTLANILQFFGGKSTWDLHVFRQAYPAEKYDPKFGYETYLLYDIKNAMYALRNETFHFKTVNVDHGSWNQELIVKMFEHDTRKCVGLERDRFYSNNLPIFYKQEDLKRTLDKLYKKCVMRQSQVPSFNSVFVRKNFGKFLSAVWEKQPNFLETDKETGTDIQLKWQSALYYLMKEIYYNGFLDNREAKELFYEALEQIRYSDKEKRAVKAFKDRCTEFKENKNYQLSQICQMIMTEYNLQNSGNRKVKTYYEEKNHPNKFQNYKMLLLKTIREAFVLYLKDEKNGYDYIFHPKQKDCVICAKEDFLPEWKTKMYEDLQENMEKNSYLQKWYITGRFLNGRSLNLLLGSIHSFIQYVEDIGRRAAQTGNKLCEDLSEQVGYYKQVDPVLSFCLKLSTLFTNEITDYFGISQEMEDQEVSNEKTANEEYAEYLSNYLDYEKKDETSALHYLQAFCNASDIPIGIYYDGQNPILNRNIVLSKLFGPEKILTDGIRKKVTITDIENLNNTQEKIKGYMLKGECSTSEEQKAVLKFQKLKNRIEFRDIVEYGEIINELLGQLINWSFLRERDLFYFQLGFHYNCLHNASVKPEGYCNLRRENGTTIHNAILYQIAAMYINGVFIYASGGDEAKDKCAVSKVLLSTGARIGVFCDYTNAILDASVKNNAVIYEAGLEVFENVKEHDNITDTRNTIDHFKYYSGNVGSILDLYSEVFDRFFTYDMKYRKNVANVFLNILKRHFVIAQVEFGTGKKHIGSKNKEKAAAHIDIKKGSIKSDQHVYKFCGGQLETDAKDQEFLATVARLLYYPNQKEHLLRGGTEGKAQEDDVKKASQNHREGKEAYGAKQQKKRGNRQGKA